MANEKNLKPIKKGQLSKEEAKRRGKKGGIKSAQVRKEIKRNIEHMKKDKSQIGNRYI